MKLTKNCKYVLDCLIEHPPGKTSDMYDTMIWTQFIDEKRLDYAAYNGILETLNADNRIVWVDSIHSKFVLTEKGRKYKEFNRLERRELWINRFWGFIFGILTAVVVGHLV